MGHRLCPQSHLQGPRPLLQQKLAWCEVQSPVPGEERVSPGRAVTPTHDSVRKRASHRSVNECSYKLFILQNRGIFYGVEHWNHSIMKLSCGNIMTAPIHTGTHMHTYTRTHTAFVQAPTLALSRGSPLCFFICIQDPFPYSQGS